MHHPLHIHDQSQFNEVTWTTIFAEAHKLAQKAAVKTENQKSTRGKEIDIVKEPRTKFVAASDSE